MKRENKLKTFNIMIFMFLSLALVSCDSEAENKAEDVIESVDDSMEKVEDKAEDIGNKVD